MEKAERERERRNGRREARREMREARRKRGGRKQKKGREARRVVVVGRGERETKKGQLTVLTRARKKSYNNFL